MHAADHPHAIHIARSYPLESGVSTPVWCGPERPPWFIVDERRLGQEAQNGDCRNCRRAYKFEMNELRQRRAKAEAANG